MSTLPILPFDTLDQVRSELPRNTLWSLRASCPVSPFVDAMAERVPPASGDFISARLGLVFGSDPIFGDEPDGRSRTNRKVREAVAAAGGREVHPAIPFLFLVTRFAFGAPNKVFADVGAALWDSLPSGASWPGKVQRLVFLHQPVEHGASYRDVLILCGEEVGVGFTVGVGSGDDGYSWGPDTAFVVERP